MPTEDPPISVRGHHSAGRDRQGEVEVNRRLKLILVIIASVALAAAILLSTEVILIGWSDW